LFIREVALSETRVGRGSCLRVWCVEFKENVIGHMTV